MRAIGRRRLTALVLLWWGAALLWGQAGEPSRPSLEEDDARLTAVLGELTASLSAGNPAKFMQSFERDFPGRARMESDVYALTELSEVLCSIEVLEKTASEDKISAALDWFLQLTSKADGNSLERRRARVTIQLSKKSGKWKVAGFEPASLFAPMKVKS